jgi:small-conductance mechanosensitive channel
MNFLLSFLPLTAAAGSADDVVGDAIPGQENTAEATENAMESVLNITNKMHLPSWVGHLVFILIVLIVARQIIRFVNKSFDTLIDHMRATGSGSGTLLVFIKNIVRVLLYFFAAVTIIYSIPGAKSTMNMLLASGGVIAVVLSFAGQDALSNVAGGVMILAFKPFAIGDFVRYVDKDISGTIEEISLRHTVIRTIQNKRLIIPNGLMNEGVVENANYQDTQVCEFLNIGITYESDQRRALALLREEVERNPRYLDQRTPEQQAAGEPKAVVRIAELADSAVVLRAWLWAADVGEAALLKFELNQAVKERFDAEGIEFAYPHLMVVKKQ